MKKHYKTKVILPLIITLILLEIISVFLTIKSFSNKNISVDNSIYNNETNETFAVLLENDEGEYIESTSSTWPSKSEYKYNEDKSACLNSSGKKVDGALDFDENNSEVKITVQEAVYCYLYFDKIEPLVGEAYALYIADNKTLTFVRSQTPYIAGETYNGKTITNVFTNLENQIFTSTTLPWQNVKSNITSVIFEDEIQPLSTEYWFNNMSLNNIDLKKLNLSKTTSISYMFWYSNLNNIDLSTLNLLNVNNLSNVFLRATLTNVNLNWNTENVINMEYMFSFATINSSFGIESWNTSKVTNMSNVFEECILNVDMNLSNWDVSNVTNHSEFNYHIRGTGTLIEPDWQN